MYEERKTLLGTTILTCIEHCCALLFKTVQRRLHLVQGFLLKSQEHRETHIDKINDREKAIRFFHLLHNAVD